MFPARQAEAPVDRRLVRKYNPSRTDGIIFEHAQWAMGSWSHEGLVVAGHGHGDQPDGDGAGLCYGQVSKQVQISTDLSVGSVRFLAIVSF
jgi:hypothetical protein